MKNNRKKIKHFNFPFEALVHAVRAEFRGSMTNANDCQAEAYRSRIHFGGAFCLARKVIQMINEWDNNLNLLLQSR